MLLYFFHKSNNFFICRGHARGKSIRGSRRKIKKNEKKKKRDEEEKRKIMQRNRERYTNRCLPATYSTAINVRGSRYIH